MKDILKKYYGLMKPGIIYGNLLTTVAGFFFALSMQNSRRALGIGHDYVHNQPTLFIAVVFGTILIIGSACVFNNYIDRAIDVKMDRTKKRALVQGTVSGLNAIIFGAVAVSTGTVILYFYTNALTTCLELLGFFSYVVLYSIAKRRTIYGVLVGSIPGAIPIVAGYCAVINNFDYVAFILFLILVAWQMPHFYGIALYRSDEYRKAGIPVLPLVRGLRRTQIEMFLYVLFFMCVVESLVFFGYVGRLYFFVMTVISLIWLWVSIKGFSIVDGHADAISKWGRGMFRYSLIVILVFSLMISVQALIS